MGDLSGLIIGGKYHVIQAVGQGGMGAVYDAVHAKTGRRVALKLIHERTIASGGPAARKRFEREARAAAGIDSLHVVQVLDSGDDERSGMPFIVMEFLQGNDLRSLIRRGPVPEHLALRVATQICLGLKRAHEVEVIHRDLKPANVFLSKADGDRRLVKLLDFGIAKLASEGTSDSVELTSTGDLVGSPPYMSPEQLRSPSSVDHRTDIWSLGVVLFEMVTGDVPTAGINPIGARVYSICHTPAAPVTTVSPKLAAIIKRALSIDPRARYQTIDEVLDAIRALSSSIDIHEADLPAGIKERDAADIPGAATTSELATTVVDLPPRPMASSSGTAPPIASSEARAITQTSARPSRRLLGVVAAVGVLSALGVGSLLTRSAPAAAVSTAERSSAPPPEESSSSPAPTIVDEGDVDPSEMPSPTTSRPHATTRPFIRKPKPAKRDAGASSDGRDKL